MLKQPQWNGPLRGEGSDYLGKMLPFSSPPSHWEKTLRHVSHCALTYSLILHTLPFEPASCGTTQSGMAYIVVHTLTIYTAVEKHWRTSLWNRCNDTDSAFTFVCCHSTYACVLSVCALGYSMDCCGARKSTFMWYSASIDFFLL